VCVVWVQLKEEISVFLRNIAPSTKPRGFTSTKTVTLIVSKGILF
jgi:hypothetical protein